MAGGSPNSSDFRITSMNIRLWFMIVYNVIAYYLKAKWSPLNALICYLMTSTDTITWSQIWQEPWQNRTFLEPVIKCAIKSWHIFVIRHAETAWRAPCTFVVVRIPCGDCNRQFRSQSCYDNHKKQQLGLTGSEERQYVKRKNVAGSAVPISQRKSTTKQKLVR